MKTIFLLTLCVLVGAACQTSQYTQTNPNGRTGVAKAASTPSQLNDIWALRQLNGKPINKADFPRRVPYFEINLRDNHMTGVTGCNRFGGPFQASGSTVKMGPLMSTKMACPNGMSVETEFLTALQAADSYKLDGKKLMFFQGTTELMTLGKGD